MTTSTEQHLGEALAELVSSQPFKPDAASIQRRARVLRRRSLASRATAGLAITAVAALVAVNATGSTSHSGTNTAVSGAGAHPATATGGKPALAELAAYITLTATDQAGDATLVERTQSYPDQESTEGFDLYTDSGEYFYAETESGLPAAIESNADQGDGMFARELAAAEYAVNGSLAVADQRMAYAPFANGQPPTQTANGQSPGQTATQRAQEAQMIAQKLAAAGIQDPQPVQTTEVGANSFNADNYIWEDSEDALQAGAGNPQVRAGILRILSTLPGITVTSTEVGGQAALAITATGTPDLPTNYSETITVNASTGIPISLVGGTNGESPGVTVTYDVSRVSVSAIEAGRF